MTSARFSHDRPAMAWSSGSVTQRRAWSVYSCWSPTTDCWTRQSVELPATRQC